MQRQGFGVVLTEESVGSGSYASVLRGTWNGRPCAVKMLHDSVLKNATALERFRNEMQLLDRLKHPNIVLCYATEYDRKKCCDMLVLELTVQDLHAFLEEKRSAKIPYFQKVDICKDISHGVQYLHSQGVVHRDLSDGNILLTWSFRAKISDFGMAREIDACNPPSPDRLTPNPGSLLYMPPEARGSYPRYSHGIDVFSCGVLTLQIAVQKLPTPGPDVVKNQRGMKRIISEVERRKDDIRLLKDGDPLRKIILRCLQDEQEKRPTANELCLLFEQVTLDQEYYAEYSLEEIPAVNDGFFKLKQQLAAKEEENYKMAAEISHLRNELQMVHLAQSSTVDDRYQHHCSTCSASSLSSPRSSISSTHIFHICHPSSERPIYSRRAQETCSYYNVHQSGHRYSYASSGDERHMYDDPYTFVPPHRKCPPEDEWYAVARPVMILGPLRKEVERKLVLDYQDRFSTCVSYSTGPVERGKEKFHRHVTQEKMETLISEGFFANLLKSGVHFYGISYMDILQLMSEGVHCILPESTRLAYNLKHRSISPIVILIIPDSPKVILSVWRNLEYVDALQQLEQVRGIRDRHEYILTAVINGDSFEKIYSEVKQVIGYHSGHRGLHLESIV